MEISRPIAIILSVFTFLVGLFIGRGMDTEPTQLSCPTYGEASVLLQGMRCYKEATEWMMTVRSPHL